MLGKPTEIALDLSRSPRHYLFDFDGRGMTRKEYIEHLYASLNNAGNELTSDEFVAAVDASSDAFAQNAVVYQEESPVTLHASKGVLNLLTGALMYYNPLKAKQNTNTV